LSLTDDLYKEIILEHFKSPRNHGRLDHASIMAQGANPFCGDELEVTLLLEGGRIREIRFEGKGCSISQASASMMTEAVTGRSLEEARILAHQFKSAMLGDTSVQFPEGEEDLEALEGVRKYPVRIKCATLSWNTLLEGLMAHQEGRTEATHLEGEEGPSADLAAHAQGKDPSPFESGRAAEQIPIGSGSGQSGDLQEQVRNALRSVIDPELNMNIVDLGLVYRIDIQDGSLRIVYTLTSPGCPLGPVIKSQIQSSLAAMGWVKEIHPELVWSPPWDPHTMASEEAKMELGIW